MTVQLAINELANLDQQTRRIIRRMEALEIWDDVGMENYRREVGDRTIRGLLPALASDLEALAAALRAVSLVGHCQY